MNNVLKRRLQAGDRLYGVWLGSASPTMAELLGWAGYDFAIIDQEHGAGSLGDAIDMMRALAATGCPAIVRVPWNDQVYLKRILDAGAESIMVPMVETPEEAAAAVAACRYPPAGRRGYAAPAMRCSRYGFIPDYLARSSDELMLIAQIESAAAVKQAEAIARTDGVDTVLIGVNDLGGSIGRLEQLDKPDVRALVEEAEAAIRRAGKPLSTVPTSGAGTLELFAKGYQLVAGAGDTTLLREAAKADLARIRAGMPGGQAY
ncbi:MAG: aldolase/citrate lyase family protein [Geminicoccaceae bacterium]